MTIARLLAAMLLLSTGPALAQSSPGFVGVTGGNSNPLKATDLNAAFANKADVIGGTLTNPTVTGQASFSGNNALSVNTAAAQGAAGYYLDLPSTAGITQGLPVTGTGIPAGSYVNYVSGGTTPVTITAPQALPSVSNGVTPWVPVTSATGLSVGMHAHDTAGILNTAASIGAIYNPGTSPYTLALSGATASGSTLPVTSGGTNCLPNDLIIDTTNPAALGSGTGEFSIATTATSVQLFNPVTAAIPQTDVLVCYPALGLSPGALVGNLPQGDAITFYPAVALTNQTTGAVASGSAITFGPAVTSISGATVRLLGLPNFSSAGLQVNGQTVAQFGGGNNYQAAPGENITIGIGAGANLPPSEGLATFVGFNALTNLQVPNAESSAFGWKAGHSLVNGSFVNLFGINTLGSCVSGCAVISAFGTDSMRNTTAAQNDIAFGGGSMINNNATGSVDIGGNQRGPSTGSLAAGTNNTSVGIGSQYGTAMSTANANSSVGFNSLYNITSGSFNVAIGRNALRAATSDTRNVAVGEGALFAQNGGSNNTVVGQFSGLNVTTGSSNSIFGQAIGDTLTTGSDNLLIGTGLETVEPPTPTSSHTVNIQNVYTASGTNNPTPAAGINGDLTVTDPSTGQTLAVAGSNTTVKAGGNRFIAFANATNGTGFAMADSGAPATEHIQAKGGTSTAAPSFSVNANATDIVFSSPMNNGAAETRTGGEASHTIPAGIDTVILNGVATSYTLTLPATSAGVLDTGHNIWIICPVAVTTLTVAANSGQTISAGAPTSCGPGAGHLIRYRAFSSTWDPIF